MRFCFKEQSSVETSRSNLLIRYIRVHILEPPLSFTMVTHMHATCIFPLTNVFMSFSFSKMERVCKRFCSSHSQCSVISFLEQPVKRTKVDNLLMSTPYSSWFTHTQKATQDIFKTSYLGLKKAVLHYETALPESRISLILDGNF